jgi:Domain of unknown function (DUF397)
MSAGTPESLAWRKSTASGTEGCVEVARDALHTRVRDSKDPHGGQLALTQDEWMCFLADVRSDEYDLPPA